MALVLHLGVLDIPYADEAGKTTGDVAEILEAKYGIMQAFYDRHQNGIAEDMAQSLEGALESILMGAPPAAVIRAAQAATGKIETRFKQFLSKREIETMGIGGVPTEAAIKGVSHRMKKRKKGRRPSFIDTGLYQQSMKAWVDGESE